MEVILNGKLAGIEMAVSQKTNKNYATLLVEERFIKQDGSIQTLTRRVKVFNEWILNSLPQTSGDYVSMRCSITPSIYTSNVDNQPKIDLGLIANDFDIISLDRYQQPQQTQQQYVGQQPTMSEQVYFNNNVDSRQQVANQVFTTQTVTQQYTQPQVAQTQQQTSPQQPQFINNQYK